MKRWPWSAVIAASVVGLLLALGLMLGDWGLASAAGLLENLSARVDRHFWLALLLFVLSFAVLAALALPIGSLYCLAAGYLFGIGTGAVAALIGACLGAALTFLLIGQLGGRGVRGRLRQSRVEPVLRLLERDAVWYLIILRVVPIAPFFLVNAAAAMTRISALRFHLATLLGLAPVCLVYAAVGNGLGSMLEARELLGPGLLLKPDVGLPLLGLLLLIALSWALRRRLKGDAQ